MPHFATSAAQLQNSSPVTGTAATASSQEYHLASVVLRAMAEHGLGHGEVLYHRICEVPPRTSQDNANQS